MEKLTKTQYWLLFHQIISFWHTFGISNGLTVPKNQLREPNWKGPKDKLILDKSFMQSKLREYLKWLEGYAESWDGDGYEDCWVNSEATLAKELKGSFGEVSKMIELLQR